MAEIITGVGVGPGDPQLLTLAGLAALRDADLVVVPARDDDDAPGHAERVVTAHLPAAEIARVPLALTDRSGLSRRRAEAWDAAAAVVEDAFLRGATDVAFATVGDPNIYSTFAYVAASVSALRPGVIIRTVPGITAFQALAAATGTVICEGDEPLLLLPARDGGATLDQALVALPDAAVVLYKSGRDWPALRRILLQHERLYTSVVGSHLGRAGESIARGDARERALPYFSTVLTPPTRTGRGGKLR